MNYKPKDGLSDAIERLRSELGMIKEELRVIEIRRPALESRAQRIGEALQMLIGDGSTGDPRWLQMPRVTEGGLGNVEEGNTNYAPVQRVPRIQKQIGPLKKPEISEDAIIAMAEYTDKIHRPVKSAELYEYLVKEGMMEPIETEMPYKSFAITLRNVRQDFIEYDRATKTWSLKDRSPKAKLKEALENTDGSTRIVSSNSMGLSREEHPFVKAVTGVFKSNRWEPMTASRLFDELSEKPNFGLIPGVGSVADLASSLSNYKDFFQYDASTNSYKAIKTEKPEVPAGVPGLYTVKSNGGVTV